MSCEDAAESTVHSEMQSLLNAGLSARSSCTFPEHRVCCDLTGTLSCVTGVPYALMLRNVEQYCQRTHSKGIGLSAPHSSARSLPNFIFLNVAFPPFPPHLDLSYILKCYEFLQAA